MDMLHFQDAVIDGMIEQNEQNDGEVLPVKRRMPMHRHHLRKDERPARNNRKKTQVLLRKYSERRRIRYCTKKPKRVTTYCENCKKKQAMCIKCLNKKPF